MDVDQLVFVRHDTNVTPEHRRHVRHQLDRARRAAAAQRVRRRAAGAARARVAAARRAGGEPRASRAASSRAAAGRSPTAQLVGGRLLERGAAGADARSRRRRRRSRSRRTRWSGSSRMPRLDIPAKVTGAYTYVHNVRVPGMLHGRLVRPRGQGAYGDGTRDRDRLGRRELDRAHRRRARRAARRLPRRRRLAGVRRDPGGGAAEGRRTATRRRSRAAATSGRRCATLDAAGQAPARIAGRTTGNVDAGARLGGAHASRDLRLPLPGPHADRPELRRRRRDARTARSCSRTRRTPTGMRDRSSRRCSACPPNRIRVQYWEGASSFGNGPARYDAGAGGGGDVAARRRAGAAPVHALGRARLGQLRPGACSPTCAAASTRTARSSRSTTPRFGIPGLVDADDPTSAARRACRSRRPGSAAPTRRNSGTQYDIPNRRVTGKSLPLWTTYFKTSALRAPRRSADVLRLGAADRRAGSRGEDGPVSSSGCRTSRRAGERRLRPVARRARRRRAARELAAARRRPRICRARTSSPAAASRSAASPARRRRSWPTSR